MFVTKKGMLREITLTQCSEGVMIEDATSGWMLATLRNNGVLVLHSGVQDDSAYQVDIDGYIKVVKEDEDA
jgi:hypothetical protein